MENSTEPIVEKISKFNWASLWQTATEWAMSTGVKVLISIVILIVSFKLINFVMKKIEKKMDGGKGKADKTLAKTFIYVLRIVLKVLVVVCIIGYLGIDTSSITALIASLGVCIGLAVNGALGNIAGCVLLLITRPFRVDDFIEVDGYTGTVEDIHLCHTRICTLDNKVVYVPNSIASGASVVNYTEAEVPYTRIHEFKHYHPEWTESMTAEKTVIMREYPKAWAQGDEPYYPVDNPESAALLAKYRAEAERIPNLIIGGRLGGFKDYDMDQAMAAALALPL